MNNDQVEKLKLKIQQRISVLETLLSESVESQQLEDTLVVDAQVAQNEKTELVLLRNNLTWLDMEDAGFCQQCDCEIPYARLLAVPTTRHCVQCAP